MRQRVHKFMLHFPVSFVVTFRTVVLYSKRQRGHHVVRALSCVIPRRAGAYIRLSRFPRITVI